MCKLIHLNYGEGTTIGKGRHGTVPDIVQVDFLCREILCYMSNTLLVIEVAEEDVNNAYNFSEFKQLLLEVSDYF